MGGKAGEGGDEAVLGFSGSGAGGGAGEALDIAEGAVVGALAGALFAEGEAGGGMDPRTGGGVPECGGLVNLRFQPAVSEDGVHG